MQADADPRPRILVYLGDLSLSGAPRTALAWVHALLAEGHFCTVVTPKGGPDCLAVPAGVGRRWLGASVSSRTWQRVLSLSQLARVERPGVILSFGTEYSLEAALVCALAPKVLPIVVVLNLLPRNGAHLAYHPSWGFPRGCHIVTVNEAFRELYLRRYGWPPAAITNVDQRFELDALIASAQQPQSGPSFDLLCLRRLDERKAQALIGLAILVKRALERLPQLSIGFVGGGNQAEAVRGHFVSVLGSSGPAVKTCFLGERDDVPALIAASRVVAGSERCLVEALALGKPALLLDEQGPAAFITAENFAEARRSNFSQISARSHELPGELVQALVKGTTEGPVTSEQVWSLDASSGGRMLGEIVARECEKVHHRGPLILRRGLSLASLMVVRAGRRAASALGSKRHMRDS